MLLDRFLPSTCAGCQQLGEPICPRCAAGLEPAPAVAAPADLDWWFAAFVYEGVVRDAITRAKYRDHRTVLSWFARQVASACPRVDVDLVTWVPASHDRVRARGVDHSEVLARVFARQRDLPVRRCIIRAHDAPQTGRTALQRREGPALRASRTIRAARVLVVDDVTTTGATATTAARALRAVGVESVGFVAVARTPGRR